MALNDRQRKLILAAEIAGYLHDLGKLHPGFAEEKLSGHPKTSEEKKTLKSRNAAMKEAGVKESHGAILEKARVYPEAGESAWLARMMDDAGWRQALSLQADDGIHANTIQAAGLGAALRQHHANPKFDDQQLSLLGDIYCFGADVRDSALDKGSGGTDSGKQRHDAAFVADSFGLEEQAYGQDGLRSLWAETEAALAGSVFREGASHDVAAARRGLYERLKPLFRRALGETRRPTNDVTLHHHCHSSASLFKAAVAEGVLRGDFSRWQGQDGLFDLSRMGQLRYRLLGIRWNWIEICRGALRPVALTNLSLARRDAIARLRAYLEEDFPVGNLLYQDDDGVVFVVPGFYEGEDTAAASEALFEQKVVEPGREKILEALSPLGIGTAVQVHWSAPRLYLTDYAEALGSAGAARRHWQVGEAVLRALWQAAPVRFAGQQVHICPQCGLRPAATRELALTEAGLDEQGVCDVCQHLQEADGKERKADTQELFGFAPATFNLQKLREARSPANNRMALISVQVDARAIMDGRATLTQLARPFDDFKTGNTELAGLETPGQLGERFNELINRVRQNDAAWVGGEDSLKLIGLVGDEYWLKTNKAGNPTDGRATGTLRERGVKVLDDFFLREEIPGELGLARHDGDRLALFAQRKHASPARLQRLWDDLAALWRRTLAEIAGTVDACLFPLSLDARGFRIIVAASDAADVLQSLERNLSDHFAKLRGGMAYHVSTAIFREKFPLYIALDAMRRMEARTVPRQDWVLRSKSEEGSLRLDWQTPQGSVTWSVPLTTGDPGQADIWHPHVVVIGQEKDGKRLATPLGPDRLRHMQQLVAGDVVSIPPASFDFVVLDSSTRRFALRYDGRGHRPHGMLGETGQSPLLMERLGDLLGPVNLVARTGWNPSQVKGLLGRIVETHEKWVRRALPALRATGEAAWVAHMTDLVARELPGQERAPLRDDLLAAICNGRFFDAVEWVTFIGKHADQAHLTTLCH